MISWQGAVVTFVLYTGAWMALYITSSDRVERQRLFFLYVNCLVLALSLYVRMPYFLAQGLVFASFILLTWAGVPVIASALCLSAVVPLMSYPVENVGGIQTLIILNTPMFIALAAFASWVLFPRQFVRRSLTMLDWTVLVFVVALAVLYSRGLPLTTVMRAVVEGLMSLGAFYFIASRGRTGSPLFVLKAIAFVGVALGAIAISETVLGWLQYASATELHGAPNPFPLGTPYTAQRYAFLRALTTFTDSIACSIFLSIAMICGITLYIADKRNRLVYAGLIAVITVGVLATFSRTGIVMLATGVFVFLFFARRYAFAFLSMLGSGVVFFAVANSETADIARSSDYRSQILDLVPLIAQKNLLLGDNMLPWQGDMKRFVQGQGIVDLVNTYLYLFVNGGIFLFFLFIALPFLALNRLPGLRSSRMDTLTILYRKCAVAICISLYMGLIFTSPTDKNLIYALCALGLMRGIALMQPRDRRGRAQLDWAPRNRGGTDPGPDIPAIPA